MSRFPISAVVLGVTLLAVTAAPAAPVDVERIWVDRLDGPAGMNDYGQAVTVAPDGTTYVAGFVFEPVGQNQFAPRFLTARYDPDGTRRWTRTYAGYWATGAAAAHHIAIDPAGDIVVSGSTNQGDDWAVVKYAPDGTERWRYVYEADSTYLTEPEDMAIDAAGNVYLVGDVGDPINPGSGVIVKVSPAGTEAWARRYSGPVLDGAFFSGVAVDDAGGIYAAGGAVVPGRASELVVVKYDAAGNEQWAVTDGSSGQFVHDRAMDVVVDANGDIVAAGGFGFNSPGGVDVAVVKLDAAGASLGRAIYDGPAHRTDAPTRAVADGAGNVIVVGYSYQSFDDADALTLKYDAQGALLWEQRVAGDEIHFDWATSVAVDDRDNVYVAGGYDPIGGVRYFVTRYAPDGTPEWLADYAGPLGGGSTAYAVAVGADGSVAVTGESPDVATEFDITSIRYTQSGDRTPGDVDGDGLVRLDDLLAVLAAWGACDDCGACPEDLDDDCAVGLPDLLLVLSNWT